MSNSTNLFLRMKKMQRDVCVVVYGVRVKGRGWRKGFGASGQTQTRVAYVSISTPPARATAIFSNRLIIKNGNKGSCIHVHVGFPCLKGRADWEAHRGCWDGDACGGAARQWALQTDWGLFLAVFAVAFASRQPAFQLLWHALITVFTHGP